MHLRGTGGCKRPGRMGVHEAGKIKVCHGDQSGPAKPSPATCGGASRRANGSGTRPCPRSPPVGRTRPGVPDHGHPRAAHPGRRGPGPGHPQVGDIPHLMPAAGRPWAARSRTQAPRCPCITSGGQARTGRPGRPGPHRRSWAATKPWRYQVSRHPPGEVRKTPGLRGYSGDVVSLPRPPGEGPGPWSYPEDPAASGDVQREPGAGPSRLAPRPQEAGSGRQHQAGRSLTGIPAA